MNNNYITLFREIAHNCEILSEQVMELDRKNNDEKGLNTATIMRNDYAKLYDRLKAEDFLASFGEGHRLVEHAHGKGHILNTAGVGGEPVKAVDQIDGIHRVGYAENLGYGE